MSAQNGATTLFDYQVVILIFTGVDTSTGTVVAEVVFEGVCLAQCLEVAARLLAVNSDFVHMVVGNRVALREGRCGADDSNAGALRKTGFF
jgi:hypothetical protein